MKVVVAILYHHNRYLSSFYQCELNMQKVNNGHISASSNWRSRTDVNGLDLFWSGAAEYGQLSYLQVRDRTGVSRTVMYCFVLKHHHYNRRLKKILALYAIAQKCKSDYYKGLTQIL